MTVFFRRKAEVIGARALNSMGRPTQWRASSCALALAVVCTPIHAGDSAVSPEVPRIPSWAALTYEAHKLMMSVQPNVSVARMDSSSLIEANDLLAHCQHPKVQEGEFVRMDTDVSVLGRRFTTDLIMSAITGDALILVEAETGHNLHSKRSAFCANEVIEEMTVPADDKESNGPISGWSQTTSRRIPYPPERSGAVLGPAGLLWLMATIDRPGADTVLTSQVWAKGQLERVQIRGVGTVALPSVSLIEEHGSRSSGTLNALSVHLTSTPVDPSASSNLQLMGLQGTLSAAIDQLHGAPVTITGSLPVLGELTVNLESITLNATSPTSESEHSDAR